ncbi:MAG: iron-sulfur cluster assembly scaffold protein [Pseudomonadota bacterium]
MTDALYTTDILRLAADVPRLDRLDAPDYHARKVSPICGSRVDVDIKITDGIVSDYGQAVRACALGQAAASIMGAQAIGLPLEDFPSIAEHMAAFLKGDVQDPPRAFRAAHVFAPAKTYKSRHASILLPFQAMTDIAQKAAAAAPAA